MTRLTQAFPLGTRPDSLNLVDTTPVPISAATRKRRKRPSATRVLLVEDNAGDARLVREMLSEAEAVPFDLMHVPQLSEALRRLAEIDFDAILLDLNLPDACGLEAISPVSEAAPGVPIVVLSGLGDERLALQAVQRGAQDYLVKGQGDGSLLARSIRYAIERKQSEQFINYMAHHDGLTGLPNRMLLLDRLEQALARTHRNRLMLAMLFLDLDHFKHVNDTLGHATGDELLKAVAARLRGCVRQSDTIARIGGDEFALILPEIARTDDVKAFAEKPMYRSKRQGRDTHSFYSPAVDCAATDRMILGTDLRHALERGELMLHYQPLVDLRSGLITGFEALARWRHPVLGLVPPATFIPLAEQRGLIGRIGQWVLQSACGEARRWREAGMPSLGVSVNLSSHQFNKAGLPEMVRRVIQENDLKQGALELELTESGIMQNPETAVLMLEELREAGVRVSVDDFGTGYSSLSHLKRFPIDGLKIDRSFIAGSTSDPIDAAIIKAIIAMAHGLGLQVTAEGVETEDQIAFLREQGCDRAQGSYYSKPVAPDTLAEIVGRGVHWN
ncbi:MAG: GGDEF domain-containing protein [Acidobacteria bacterium]|nr:MAG: GGDEF domain-containing protein [Acidobacteriota bacterium]